MEKLDIKVPRFAVNEYFIIFLTENEVLNNRNIDSILRRFLAGLSCKFLQSWDIDRGNFEIKTCQELILCSIMLISLLMLFIYLLFS